jgi:uncharacterized protein with FMN-binding domain
VRRAIPVIASTAGGLVLLANFHTSPGAATVASGAPSPPTTAATPSTSASSRGALPTPQPTTTTTSGAARTITGPVASTDYGDVQVQVVLQGTKIVDVKALELPNDRSRSARISQQAGPLLRQEALRAQSANIDLLSGATYTSDGYIRSLQGALDQAGR